MSDSVSRISVLKDRLQSDDDAILKKTLKELDRVNMTIDMLKETGIGIAVNQLRHHDIFGSMARQLVSKWKESATADVESNNRPKNGYTSTSHSSKSSTTKNSSKRSHEEDRNHSSSTSPPPVSKKSKSDTQSSKKKKSRTVTFTSADDDNDEDFTAEFGSFDQILGLNDSTQLITGSSAKNRHENTKKDKKKYESNVDNGRSTIPKSLQGYKATSQTDWSKVLPTKLTTEYRPQPQRMIFDLDEENSSHGRSNFGTTSEDVDFAQMKSQKRTQVYSGRRNIFLQQVPTLFESCIHVLCDNIDALGFTGGVPFYILKPVLERASAAQLYRLEEWNPYLLEDTGDLWKGHCNRDFKNVEPDWEEGETWRELYERMLAERDKKLDKLKRVISEQQAAKESAVRQAKMALAKAPREVRRRQIRYGTHMKEARVPDATEIVQSRKNLDLHPGDRSKVAKRNFSHIYEEEQRQKEQPKNRKEKVAPLMAKSLKMMKMSRGR